MHGGNPSLAFSSVPGQKAGCLCANRARRTGTGNHFRPDLVCYACAVRKIHSSAWLLAVVSAGLQVAIFPLPGLYWLAWVAVAPLLVAILRARPAGALQVDAAVKLAPASPWQGFLLAYLCGILWCGGTCYWVFETMHRYGGLPVPMAAMVLILFCMYIGLYHGFFGLLVAVVAGRGSCEAGAGVGSVPVGGGGTGAHTGDGMSMGAAGLRTNGQCCAYADGDVHRRLWTVV